LTIPEYTLNKKFPVLSRVIEVQRINQKQALEVRLRNTIFL